MTRTHCAPLKRRQITTLLLGTLLFAMVPFHEHVGAGSYAVAALFTISLLSCLLPARLLIGLKTLFASPAQPMTAGQKMATMHRMDKLLPPIMREHPTVSQPCEVAMVFQDGHLEVHERIAVYHYQSGQWLDALHGTPIPTDRAHISHWVQLLPDAIVVAQ